MRLTAVWLSPAALASDRVLQCVELGGSISNVMVTARSTSASVIVRGAPGRGSPSSPSRRHVAKRSRHVITVGRLTPSALATPVLLAPGSAQANTI